MLENNQSSAAISDCGGKWPDLLTGAGRFESWVLFPFLLLPALHKMSLLNKMFNGTALTSLRIILL